MHLYEDDIVKERKKERKKEGEKKRELLNWRKVGEMIDWAPPIVAVALFAFLCPGLIFQMPGKHKPVEFMNMKTSVISVFVHSIIYCLLLMLFLVVLRIHIHV
ncbi:hypothetical protein MKW94_003274 [Papaver nudicaule]|uniref:Uncharacterized protein n=1 Tax=Papaver nudicaule TaxID=74823 RepID=A0AA41VKG5_PAPNU|nr:hypothetical protein [Papaver nudicaule]